MPGVESNDVIAPLGEDLLMDRMDGVVALEQYVGGGNAPEGIAGDLIREGVRWLRREPSDMGCALEHRHAVVDRSDGCEVECYRPVVLGLHVVGDTGPVPRRRAQESIDALTACQCECADVDGVGECWTPPGDFTQHGATVRVSNQDHVRTKPSEDCFDVESVSDQAARFQRRRATPREIDGERCQSASIEFVLQRRP